MTPMQEAVEKLNSRYHDKGNCAIIALAMVSGRTYLSCREALKSNGWTETGITFQGLLLTCRELGVRAVIEDGQNKRLRTWAKRQGTWIASTKDHFSVIKDGELINPQGCENHQVRALLRVA